MKIMKYRVECFSNETEKLISHFDITGMPLSKFQELFDRPSDDPMHYCYEIDEEKAKFFSFFFGIDFNFELFSYSLCKIADYK